MAREYIVSIGVNGKKKPLIKTDDLELAIFCREEAELTYYGKIYNNGVDNES